MFLDLFDFTSLFAWTFLKFLARCDIISQKNQIGKKISYTFFLSYARYLSVTVVSCVRADIFWIFFHSSEFSCIFQLSGVSSILITSSYRHGHLGFVRTHTKISSALKSVEKTSIANDTMFKGYTMNGDCTGERLLPKWTRNFDQTIRWKIWVLWALIS